MQLNLDDPGVLIKIFLAVIALVTWLIRLEGRVNYHEKDINSHKKISKGNDDKVNDKIDNISKDVSYIKTSLARIEGRLESKED